MSKSQASNYLSTGTNTQFLQLPQDINAPKPNYFFNVFWMVHSYINLLANTPNPVPGKGLVKLFSYRMGVLSPDTSIVEDTYIKLLEQNSKKVKTELSKFGEGLISYNLITIFRLISNTLINDIQKGYGDDKCLTSETMKLLLEFCKFHQNNKSSIRNQRYDDIKSVVETARYNALYYTPGVSSLTEIVLFIDVVNEQLRTTLMYDNDETARRQYLLDIVRILFYIGCRYYHVNVLRFTDQRIKRPYTRDLQINDFTLAAIPFDPTMIFTCSDEVGTMSRFGIEYVQSLSAVLSDLGGVEAIVNVS